MTLTHLLRPKQRLHFPIIGYSKSTRWCSSTASVAETEKSSPSKKGGGAREQKEKAVESYVNKYMESNPGVFPKPTHVHKEIGGSWYTLKDILQNLKEKILGNTQLHDLNPNIDSKTPDSPNKTEVDGGKITVSPTDTLSGNTMNPPASKALKENGYLGNFELKLHGPNPNIDSKATNGPDKPKVDGDKITVSPILTDTLSGNIMNPPASKSIIEHGHLGDVELKKSENSVQSSVETMDSFTRSKIIAKILQQEFIRENSKSDKSKLAEFKTGEQGPKEPEGIKVNFNSDLISKSDKLPSEKSRDSFVNRLRCIGYGNQDESTMNNSSSKVSSLFGGMDKTRSSSNLSMKMKNSQQTVKCDDFTKSHNTPTLQELVESKLTSSKYKNNQSASHRGAQKEALPVIETNEMLTHASSSEYSKSGEGEAKGSELRGLINCIKVLPRDGQSLVKTKGRIVNSSTERDPLIAIQSQDKIEDTESGDSTSNAFDRLNSKRVPLQLTEKEFHDTRGSDQNKIIVRFLPKTAGRSDVYKAFRSCGDIERVEFLNNKGNGTRFAASVCFKTVDGMKRALERRVTVVLATEVIVEEAASATMDYSPSNMLPVPNLIGDAYSALIRNPKRTVAIKTLTPDICYHHIEEALAFCESKISAVLFGSSKSIAFVEFKTEEGKEKALAKHSIVVLGKQLSISRIDAPRTTVVRLSNLRSACELVYKFKPICESFGKIKSTKFRHSSILDVYFELDEWPNMLNIVNRLNGMKVGNELLVAAPAPIFPREILRALWSKPDERKHVKAVLRGLLHKFGESSVNKVALADIAAKLYGD